MPQTRTSPKRTGLTESEFESLLKTAEGETLDFKATMYDLHSEHSKFSLVKDVITMANTPRDEDSHIVCGVKRNADGSQELLGCGAHPDEADIQSQLVERVYPIPTFTYEALTYKGKSFGIITIPAVLVGPCVPVRDYGQVLRRLQIYFRRGSKNDVAAPADLNRILAWFRGAVPPSSAYSGHPGWARFIDQVERFEQSRYFFLVANAMEDSSVADISAIGLVPWVAAFDFDPESDGKGLLHLARPSLESRRSIHIVTIRDRPTYNLRTGTYWYFPRGLSGRDALDAGIWKDWQRQYVAGLQEQIARLAAETAPTPVTVVALWYGSQLPRYIRTQADAMLAAFGERLNLVLLTNDANDYADLASDLDACVIEMPLHHFCSGLKVELESKNGSEPADGVPSSSEITFVVPPK